MKNILVVHQSSELYGSDKTLLLLLTCLDKTEFLTVVVLPGQGPLVYELEKQGIKVVIFPVLKLYRKMFTPANLLLFVKQLRTVMPLLDALNDQYRFSAVYSNTLAVLLGMFFARRRKIRHIWHVHEIVIHPKIFANLFAFLLKKWASIVVCNSNATKLNLTNRIPSLKEKCIVVYNGLNPQVQEHTSVINREVLGFSSEDIVITLVGRISRLKGHKWLLNTYIKYLNNSNIKLLFVGSPVPGQENYLVEIETILNKANLRDRVKILPFTKDLDGVWNSTDIAIMPSTEAESFGLVALEAMLAKKPVIAANHGGLTEIVVNNTTGVLVEPDNEQRLAEAITRLKNNTVLRADMGQKGYERAIDHFSQEKYVQGISDILKAN